MLSVIFRGIAAYLGFRAVGMTPVFLIPVGIVIWNMSLLKLMSAVNDCQFVLALRIGALIAMIWRIRTSAAARGSTLSVTP